MSSRRQFLSLAAATGLATALPLRAQSTSAAQSPTAAPALRCEIKRLNLRHTWTTTMASSSYRESVHTSFTRDGITGHGEGAPIIRYRESPAEAAKAINAVADQIAALNPRNYRDAMAAVRKLLGPNQHAAVAAVDIALFDWLGQKLGIPVYELFGLDPKDTPPTDFSIGIDTPEITQQKTREAEEFPLLKIKVGLATDEATIEAVRSVTKKPLRVDANEGWTDKEEAIRKINWLETQGVQYVEQPMPAHMIEETRYVRSKVHLPIIADEACTELTMIPRLAEAFDGINVKLDKAGGLLESVRWIEAARAQKMSVMLGCMVSSSCSITAAAHIAPLVDHVDLDGNLLLSNDPWSGVKVQKGRLIVGHAPGLGLTPA